MQTKLAANYKLNSKWHKQQKTAPPLQTSMSNQPSTAQDTTSQLETQTEIIQVPQHILHSKYIMYAKARWSDHVKDIKVGVSQGCPLAMHLFASVISELIYRINQKPANEERFMVAIGYADDILILVREKDAIRIAMAEYERLKLEVNTNKTSSNDQTLFENKSGIVTYLGQEFGQNAKPLTDQILANVQERIGSLFDLDISLHNRYTLYEK
ncbi:Reverse_transcriptase (RNA-dependent DNA polymerase) [Hexamita inflata]|uniref:Reverse transcriptase (RNA-dependent DNA polymerase) n=1 Tax=Hexamita inflata TaxID=28002 RepID=A0AA86RA27_9EUKA|nr:Reverse transcriptase (RNA-dependent DNA polymerase) [Hexamita inflata]